MPPTAAGTGLARTVAMADRKMVLEMFGEFCREASVLTAVFIPLDLVLIDRSLTPGWGVAIIGISGGLLTLGMAVERWRK
jgi:hypothetical protein